MLVSTSAAIAPLLGGVIVAVFGWRAMFFLAAPIAAVAVVAVGLRPARRSAATALQQDRSADDPRARAGAAGARSIDAPGLALLALVLIAFLVALRGGDSAPIAAIACAACVGVSFVSQLLAERAQTSTSIQTPTGAVTP